MSEYRRPGFATEIYCDEQGSPIDYCHRWPGDSPPEDAYSRVSHLERFGPLHEVADALIEWLLSTFDAVADQDPGVAQDLLHLPVDVVRAVRVVPSNPLAAPLTFAFTGFPGVFLHAGALHDFDFPVCGCDACDDDASSVAEKLEWTVRTVVAGGYSEWFDPGRGVESSIGLMSPESAGIRHASVPKTYPVSESSPHEPFSRPTGIGCPGQRRRGKHQVPENTDKAGTRGASSAYGSRTQRFGIHGERRLCRDLPSGPACLNAPRDGSRAFPWRCRNTRAASTHGADHRQL